MEWSEQPLYDFSSMYTHKEPQILITMMLKIFQ